MKQVHLEKQNGVLACGLRATGSRKFTTVLADVTCQRCNPALEKQIVHFVNSADDATLCGMTLKRVAKIDKEGKKTYERNEAFRKSSTTSKRVEVTCTKCQLHLSVMAPTKAE